MSGWVALKECVCKVGETEKVGQKWMEMNYSEVPAGHTLVF